jgi:hypothetical protein
MSWITLPNDAFQSIMQIITNLFNDVWALITIALGVPLAFYIIARIKQITNSLS